MDKILIIEKTIQNSPKESFGQNLKFKIQNFQELNKS